MSRASLLATALALCGCAGPLMKLAPLPPVSGYERLGRVEGTGCGTLGLVATSTYLVPIALGSRIPRAYDAALAQKPGATGLVDVKVTEYWLWWVLATTRCTTVAGEAIR